MTTMLELMQKVVSGEAPKPPVAELIGFSVTSIEPGTLHGGILCDIADAAMGMAHAATLLEGETFTTLELKINFLRPVWNAHLRAVGTVLRGGRTVTMTQCDVLDEADRLVARASATQMTLRGGQAEGR
jgi:uncharacterized protein (TIGR00369 family)